jgi:hypothetical protein
VWTQPQFDQHQFERHRAHAVSATLTADGWDTPGISYADFSSMHVERRKKRQERRLTR